MSKEATQIEHVRRLLDRQRLLSQFGYSDEFITVSLAEVEGALAEGAAEWDTRLGHESGPHPEGVDPESIVRFLGGE